MSYKELINHLFNINLLSSLDRHKNTITEYLNSIETSTRLITELKLKDTNLNYKQVQQIIDKSGELSFTTFKNKTNNEITRLLKETGIEEPLFGSIGIEVKSLLEIIRKNTELKEYIFGKDSFNKINHSGKSKEEILSYYIQLKGFQSNISFIEYLKLLESIYIPLNTSIKHLITELINTLKKKRIEEQTTHLRTLNKNNETILTQSSYLVVSEVINYDYKNEIEFATFLYTFTKSNAIDQHKLPNLKHYFITLFFDAYIKHNYNQFLNTILLNEDEIFAILQNRNSLSKFVLPSNIVKFELIEKQLIKEGYFGLSAKWNEKNKKTKKSLVEFILHCHSLGYFIIRAIIKDNKELNKLRRFFEYRYSIEVTNQFKPNQRKSILLPSNEFRWIEKAF